MKVIFPGSFDPLTNGHKSIVLKALNIFDSVDIVILNNINKNPLFSLEERKKLYQIYLKNIKMLMFMFTADY